MTFRRDGLPFILFLGGLTAVSPLSIDMALPAFPQIEADFGSTAQVVSYSVSIFLIGFALGPLVLGPLSDRFGRRPVLLAGFLIFTLAGLGCALSSGTGQLLAWRLAEGIGAGAGGILPFIIVRDLFEGKAAHTRMSAITAVLGVGPIVAPILGTVILQFSDWRGVFEVLTACGVVLLALGLCLFAESHSVERRHPLSALQMMRTYVELSCHRNFMLYTIMNAAGFGCMFAYIAASPAILMGNLHASAQAFSLLFGCSAAAFMIGAAVNGIILGRTGNVNFALLLALVAMLVGSVGMLGLSLVGSLSPVSFAICAGLAMFGSGLLAPSTIHEALHGMGPRSGVASAAFRFVQMIAAAGASALVGLLYDGHTANSLGIVMLITAVVGLVTQMMPVSQEAEVLD